MKKQILFVFFLSLTLVTSAKQRTEQELQNAARQFLLGKDAHRMEAMNRSSIKAIIKDSQLTIFDSSDGKCVIVANDDISSPYLAIQTLLSAKQTWLLHSMVDGNHQSLHGANAYPRRDAP